MNSLELFKMGLKNLFRRKARTFLTVLGVIIGTAAIIVMMSLGLGMEKSMEESLSRYGNIRVVEVYSGSRWGEEPVLKPGEKKPVLDDETVNKMREIANVEAVMAQMSEYVTVKAGRYESGIQLVGVDFEDLKKFGMKLSEGTYPDGKLQNSVIFGFNAKDDFYDPKSRNWRNRPEVDVMTAALKLQFTRYNSDGSKPKTYPLNVVALTDPEDYEYGYRVMMDVEEFEKIKVKEARIAKKNGNNGNNGGSKKNEVSDKYSDVKVLVNEIDNVKAVQDQIKEMGFQTSSMTDALNQAKESSAMIQAVLAGIGAVSLFIAAIGITNTMIMSIYERTREIGVMKVLGAELKDIKRLFLFEAAMIGFNGGILGIGLSYGASYLLNTVGPSMGGMGMGMGMGGEGTTISYIPIWLTLSGIVFATVVGVVSGYYPARRAMKLSALEAIKNE